MPAKKESTRWFRSAPTTNPALQHYCRVCNIQLNSCRQVRIHVEGKKHLKRLHYLKMCLETSGKRFCVHEEAASVVVRRARLVSSASPRQG